MQRVRRRFDRKHVIQVNGRKLTAAQRKSLARDCAQDIYQAFGLYNFYFHVVTQRARTRFIQRDWRGSQRDAVQRIELYDHAIDNTIAALREKLGEHVSEREIWRLIKSGFDEIIGSFLDREFTKTFFSSITRRMFGTVGVDPDVEFVAGAQAPLDAGTAANAGGFRTYHSHGSVWAMAQQLLSDYEFPTGYADKAQSIQHLASEIERACVTAGGIYTIQSIDVIRQVFYRDNRAYLMGRIIGSDFRLPLMIALKSTSAGVLIDAVITSQDTVSIIFSFSRSYIHADLDIVRDAVVFIAEILPKKPISEIYTVLGRAKQGKTERYRNVFDHLHHSTERFRDAAFDRGMVMVVFTLPSYPIVFKVIRDRFAYPKTTARRDVIRAYKLVFKHDRAGRLIDAQEFRHLSFAKDRFEPALLKELIEETADTVQIDGDEIVIEHAYIERRLAPLNRYLREAAPAAARAAVIDYGQAIRDLAASNIFPGDLLLKNFGVTRHGRVIFYDYDELCLLTDCNFRDLPEAHTHEEEMQAGAWYYVADNDVFPEQFASFLGLKEDLLKVFVEHHAELLRADYWRNLKMRIEGGAVEDVLPYAPRP